MYLLGAKGVRPFLDVLVGSNIGPNLSPDTANEKGSLLGTLCHLARPEGFEPPTAWFVASIRAVTY